MVKVDTSTFGQNNRISLVSPLPALLNLERGDEVVFYIENGEVVVRKKTKLYNGIDFEGKDIKERLLEYESQETEKIIDTSDDPEEIKRLAYEEYKKDQERKKLTKHD